MSSICLPPVVPKPSQDCLDLHRAFKGLGCDAEGVIRILAHRDALQRSELRIVYKNMFDKDLCERLKSELHYHFKKAMLMWMRDASERDARILKRAIKSSRTFQRNHILAEVLSTRSLDDVCSIAKAYHSLYDRSLENDIEQSLSGSCQKLFLLYLSGNQCEAMDLEPHVLSEEVKKLHNSISTHIDEATVMHTLTSRNCRQLCSIFDAYKATYGRDICEVVEEKDKKGKSEFNRTVRIIIKCVSNPEDYFAEVLYKSMKGLGTDDDTLIRVIVTHAEIDLAHIKAAFVRRYKKSLPSMVHSDTTNNYRKFLLALMGAPY